jgi:hypothetical protein
MEAITDKEPMTEFTTDNTTSQAALAKRAGIHHSTLKRCIERGELSTTRVGKRDRITLDAADNFILNLRSARIENEVDELESPLLESASFTDTPDRHAAVAERVFSEPVAPVAVAGITSTSSATATLAPVKQSRTRRFFAKFGL